MARKQGPGEHLATAARWPVGVLLTAWAYLWRTTPAHRRELDGAWPDDAPPAIPAAVEQPDMLAPEDGVGRYLRRRYSVELAGARMSAPQLMAELRAEPDRVAPGALAHFRKVEGQEGSMRIGDEFTVRMPGPWDGPVRVVDLTPTSFRFATLDGHIEAGQIEWRARDDGDRLVFEIESWSRPADRVSDLMHHHLRMAKEVQLHMWTSVLERVVRHTDGRRAAPLDIETRVVTLAD